MRALAFVIALLASRSAFAFVIDLPLIPTACEKPVTWDAQVACLTKHGTVTVLHESKDVKVVRITTPGTTPRDLGMYLYVQRAALWHLSGMYEPGGESELLGIKRLKLGGHHGYQLDIGRVLRIHISLDDGATNVPAIVRHKYRVFCSNGYNCPDAMTDCDVLVNGKAYWTFHGTLRLEKEIAFVDGDRSRAGTFCAAQPRVVVGWPG